MIYIQSIRANDVNPDGGKQIEFGKNFFRSFGWQADTVHRVVFHYNDQEIITSFTVRGSQRGGNREGADCKEYASSNGVFPLKQFLIENLGLTTGHIDRVSLVMESLDEHGSEFNLYLANYIPESSRNSISLPFNNSWIQTIKYGAPGTGKSQSLKEKEEDGTIISFRTTFHPDTDYASFVGCYKPTVDQKSKVSYGYTSQVFLDAYFMAWNNPSKNYALNIEEINRGNCALIFGDLFQLLDRRSDGFSNYPIIADSDLQKVLRNHLPINYDIILRSLYLDRNGNPTIEDGWKVLSLPPNFSIYATMNTSDQSLYKMDSAFKRRWDWEYVPIRYKAKTDEDGNVVAGDEGLAKLANVHLDFYPEKTWLEILKAINSFIKYTQNSTSKQIGQWFLNPKRDEQGNFLDISFEQFRNKIIFYLFNDVFKKSMQLREGFETICDHEEGMPLFEDLCIQEDGGKAACNEFIKYIIEERYKD